ncbi:MAG: hypothetical protein IJ112_03930 [Oscillospiraceae bacterium]|nr:hypothetical protein [Oscillospiraceae bacterium]
MKKRTYLLVLAQAAMMLLFVGYYWYCKGNVTPNYIVFCIYLIPAVLSLCVASNVGRIGSVPGIVLYLLLAAALPPLCYYATYCITDPPADLAELLIPPGASSLIMAVLGLCAGLFQRKLDREGRSDDPYNIKHRKQ